MNTYFKNLIAFILIFLFVFGGAAVGGIFTPGEWYQHLNKPSWNPPNRIFGPVWTILYISMAVAACLIWTRRQTEKIHWPAVLFGIQLFLNALWTPLFFGLHWMGTAFIEILALEMVILACIHTFWKYHRLAAGLMVPYALWVAFAAFLNYTLWAMNA